MITQPREGGDAASSRVGQVGNRTGMGRIKMQLAWVEQVEIG